MQKMPQPQPSLSKNETNHDPFNYLARRQHQMHEVRVYRTMFIVYAGAQRNPEKVSKKTGKIINDNSDIFAFCTCKGSFHRLSKRITTCTTLMTQSTQKKVKPSTRKPKRARRKRKSTASTSSVPFTPACRCCSLGRSTSQSSSDETASPPPVTPVFLFDTNVPGLPYRSPTPNPTNLELAQVRHYLANQPSVEV